jgi:TonB family protein
MLISVGARIAEQSSVVIVSQTWSATAKAVTQPITAGDSPWTLGPILLVLWGLGSGAVLAYWLVRAVRLRAILRRAERDPNPLTVDGLRLDVVRTDARLEPGVVGLFRHVLLLPRGLETRLTPQQLRAILAHEFCHVRRRDNLTATVHMLVEAVFWFHPLVWWIGARLVDERERACDERVVACGHDPEAYAEAILNVCEHFARSPLRCAAGISGSELNRRIAQIMRYREMSSLKLAKKLFLGAAGGATFAIPLLAGLTVQNTVVAQTDPCRVPTPAEAVNEVARNQPRTLAWLELEGGYTPIIKVAPRYPERAAERGLDGYAIVEYSIAPDGKVENAFVVESSSSLFDSAVLESTQKYRYKPCVLNGQAIAAQGVRTKVYFQIDGNERPQPNYRDDDGDEVVIVKAASPTSEDAP